MSSRHGRQITVQKTIVCRLFNLTKRKTGMLDDIYTTWKVMTITRKPYRQNREMFPTIYSKYCSQASVSGPNDPIKLDTQSMFEVIKTDNVIPYVVRITVMPRVRIYCPLKTKATIDGTICDSKLFKVDGHYELHLVVSKTVSLDSNPRSILAVDLGEKVIATAVLLQPSTRRFSRPIFMGRAVRGLRRHYAWLKKRLGRKKLQNIIKRIGNAESRKVNDILHKISKEIVRIAKESNAMILVGDLTGIRKAARGKRMNRIVANMPYYKLTRYITYKASLAGVYMLTTKEWYSSKTCSSCGSDHTSRPRQGLFRCHGCRYECNADYNGAKNLAKRLAEHAFANGTLGFGCKSRTPFFDPASDLAEDSSG